MAFQISNDSRMQYRPMADINVTPFVDVMLVLLVIFMVTAPMMVEGLKVQLPQAQAPALEQSEQKITITLTKDEHILVADAEVPLDKLKEVLEHNAKLKQDKEVFLHADRALPYGFVMKVMAIAKASGADSIGMVTEEGK